MARSAAAAVVLAVLLVVPVSAQERPAQAPPEGPSPACTSAERGARGADVRLLLAVHCVEAPAFAGFMRATDAVSRPVYFAAVPAAWAGTLAFRAPDAGYADAYRLTLTQAVAFGAFAGLKRVIRRPRPFRGTPGVVSRSDRYYAGRADVSYSMPSGHATLAAALATSWSLSHPRWFVVAPSALWAGSTSLSRVWLGVHYPSDVVAGTLLGAGVGVLVHVLGPHVTPAFLEADDDTAPPPMMSMTIRF